MGPEFSWAGAARGGDGPAADRLPPCPVRAAGVRPPSRASGLWKRVSLAPRCWQPGGPRGVTPGALHLHGQGPDRTRAQLLCSQWTLLPTASVLTPQTASPRRSCIVLGLSPDVPWSS